MTWLLHDSVGLWFEPSGEIKGVDGEHHNGRVDTQQGYCNTDTQEHVGRYRYHAHWRLTMQVMQSLKTNERPFVSALQVL